ncbi:DUF5808 domain-containing protein [Paenibacillus albus]|uniref:DUF1648 domain-containing protein n=1 Tax=Paenibacillus albus TaxID=2495582 RepID=A0A3Q8X399_9BACL|nr:DUF5808 domain-containing protein [Paenibacillus albus]AZN39496.1 DUF1648 domain-containing protein [Paenibacillus albus]
MTAGGIKQAQRAFIQASWYLVQIAIIAASVIAAVLMWDRIPERLAVHYDIKFHPDRYSEKSGSSVFILNGIQLFLLALLMGAERVVTVGAVALGKRMPEERQGAYRHANGLFIYALSLLLVAFFSYVQATMLYGWPTVGAMVATIVLIVLIIAGVAALIVHVRRLGIGAGDLGEGEREGKWIAGGGIYYNPQDSALFVPKRYGIGLTMNFGRPLSWVILLGILAVPVLIIGIVEWVK